jgi:hypothetical protein
VKYNQTFQSDGGNIGVPSNDIGYRTSTSETLKGEKYQKDGECYIMRSF